MRTPLLIFSVFLAACGEDSEVYEGPRQGLVGQVSDTDAFIAIVAGEIEAKAYVCNGEEGVSEWFEGTLEDPDSLELSNAAGGRLSGQRVGEAFEGEVTLSDGEIHSFSTEVAIDEAGLYRVLGNEAEAAELKAGWIVNNDGEQRGALLLRGAFESTPALPDDGLLVGGTTYPVFRFQLAVRKPLPPAGPVPVPYPSVGTVAK